MPASIVVYPTHAHAARERAVSALADPTRVALGRTAISIGELERSLASAALRDVHVLSRLEERLLLREVASSDAARAGRFARIADTPGFVDALGATLAACRQAGVDAAALRSVLAMVPAPVALRLTAVAELFERFEARARALHAIDVGSVPWETARALVEGAPLPALVGSTTRVLVRHVRELHPARLALLTALGTRLTPPGELVIELPYVDGGGSWFRAIERVLGRVEALGASSITVLPVDPKEPVAPRDRADQGAAFLAAVVGAPGVFTGSSAGASQTHVRVIEAPDPESEHRIVAAVVRDLVDAGTPPERIAIAARSVAAHAGPLTEALEARGVPVHERRGTPLSLAPPIRWLRGVLDAVCAGFPRADVRALLSSAYASRWTGADGAPGGAAIARVLDEIGVRVDEEATPTRLLDALARFAEGPSAPRAAARVHDAVSDFVTRAAPLGHDGTVLELVARVRRFANVSGLGDAVSRRGASRGELRALIIDQGDRVSQVDGAAFGRDRAALDALEVALDALGEAASRTGLSQTLDAATLHALLSDALAEQTVQDGGLRGGAVRVMSMRDLAGLEMDAVVLVGLCDGELPARPPHDPLMSVSDRLLVARALGTKSDRAYSFDVDEDTSAGRVAFATGREAEPLTFLLAAAAATDRLFLTRSCTDRAGRPVVASPLLEDARAALDAQGAHYEHERPPIEPAPTLDRAAGLEDVRRAFVRALATVAPGTCAADAARDSVEARVLVAGDPATDGVAATVMLRDLIARVDIERRRTAILLQPGEIPTDEYAGTLRDESALAEAFGSMLCRPIAATTLEELARCPFQFFAKRGLRLGADTTAEDDPDARRRGTLAHACFQAAMEALIAEGVVPYRASLAERAAAVARRAATPVAERGFGSLPFDAVVLGVVRDDTVDRVVRLVRALYLADDGFSPVAAEQSFGDASESDVSESDTAGERGVGLAWPALEVPTRDGRALSVRGRIDLVEASGAEVRVVDLKSSAQYRLEQKLGPTLYGVSELQLPLYAAVARKACGARQADARYLSLKDGVATKSVLEKRAAGRSWKGDERDERDLTDLVGAGGEPTVLARSIDALAQRVVDGDFEVRPVKGACDVCDYANVCRISRGAPEPGDGGAEEG